MAPLILCFEKLGLDSSTAGAGIAFVIDLTLG
jgi:hypothetical protein